MAPLGGLSQAWVSAEASLPLGWQIRGLLRFDDLWIALSEGPAFDDYLSGSGQYADQRCGDWRIGCASGADRR